MPFGLDHLTFIGIQTASFAALAWLFIHFSKWLANRKRPRDVYFFGALIIAICSMQLLTVAYFDQQNNILAQYNQQVLTNQQKILDTVRNLTLTLAANKSQYHFTN